MIWGGSPLFEQICQLFSAIYEEHSLDGNPLLLENRAEESGTQMIAAEDLPVFRSPDLLKASAGDPSADSASGVVSVLAKGDLCNILFSGDGWSYGLCSDGTWGYMESNSLSSTYDALVQTKEESAVALRAADAANERAARITAAAAEPDVLKYDAASGTINFIPDSLAVGKSIVLYYDPTNNTVTKHASKIDKGYNQQPSPEGSQLTEAGTGVIRITLTEDGMDWAWVSLAEAKADDIITSLDYSDFPDYPENGQQYWIIFNEGTRKNRMEMSTVDASGNPDDDTQPYILWDMGLSLQNAEPAGSFNQYYLNNENTWEQIGEYHTFTDSATRVIASNLDVQDAAGDIIVHASEYSQGQNAEANLQQMSETGDPEELTRRWKL